MTHCLPCPLCANSDSDLYHRDARRLYRQCRRCRLVFVPPEFHLTTEQEKAVYDQHENDPLDPGYRRFLSRLADPLKERLRPGAEGLDFGCGPGPALALLLAGADFPIRLHDPIYWDDPDVWNHTYDFITASEVFEHLREPAKEWKRLLRNLKVGGWLAVMTKRVSGVEAFRRWHYILDPTHILFFSLDTFTWLAAQDGLDLHVCGPDVVLFQRKP